MLKTFKTKTEKSALAAVIVLGSALLLAIMFIDGFTDNITEKEVFFPFARIVVLGVAFFLFDNANTAKWLVFSGAAAIAVSTLIAVADFFDIIDNLGDWIEADALSALGTIANLGFSVTFLVFFALAFFKGVANPNLD